MTYCVTCPPGRNRIPRRGLVCDGCRSWLAGMLSELPSYVAELLIREPVPDAAPHRAGTDPVAELLPAASVASKTGAPRVSGSRERPAPTSVNVIDLTSNPRYGCVHDEYGDQVGEHAVLTILDTWVRDLRRHRSKGERLPTLTVDQLANWLTVRIDDACDTFEPITDLADDIRHLHNALRAHLGLAGPDVDLKEGVSCLSCDHQELYHHAGGKFVECGNCPVLLTLDEFDRWVRLSATSLVYLRGTACETCNRHQMYRLKGTAMPRCGWCEWHTIIKEAA